MVSPGYFYSIDSTNGKRIYIKVRNIRSLAFDKIAGLMSSEIIPRLIPQVDPDLYTELEELNIPAVAEGAIAYYTIYTIDDITSDADISLLLEPFYLDNPVKLDLIKRPSGIEGVSKWVGYYHLESLESPDWSVCDMEVIKDEVESWVLPGGMTSEGWNVIHSGRIPRMYDQTKVIHVKSLVRQWSDSPLRDNIVLPLRIDTKYNIDSVSYQIDFWRQVDGMEWGSLYDQQDSAGHNIPLPGFNFLPDEREAPVFDRFYIEIMSPLRLSHFYAVSLESLQNHDFPTEEIELPNAAIISFEYLLVDHDSSESHQIKKGQVLTVPPGNLAQETNEALMNYLENPAFQQNVGGFDMDLDGIDDIVCNSSGGIGPEIIRSSEFKWDRNYTDLEVAEMTWYRSAHIKEAGQIFIIKTSTGKYAKLRITGIEQITDEQLDPFR